MNAILILIRGAAVLMMGAQSGDPGKPDGIMGPKTRGSLKAFQQDCGLEPPGELDNGTCQRLALRSSSSR